MSSIEAAPQLSYHVIVGYHTQQYAVETAAAIDPDTSVVAIEFLALNAQQRAEHEEHLRELVGAKAQRTAELRARLATRWGGSFLLELMDGLPRHMQTIISGRVSELSGDPRNAIGSGDVYGFNHKVVQHLPDRHIPVVTYDTDATNPDIVADSTAGLEVDTLIRSGASMTDIRSAEDTFLRLLNISCERSEEKDVPRLEAIGEQYGGEVTVTGGLAHAGLADALRARGHKVRLTIIGDPHAPQLELLRILRQSPEATLPENLLNRDVLIRYLTTVTTPDDADVDQAVRIWDRATRTVAFLSDSSVADSLRQLDAAKDIKDSDERSAQAARILGIAEARARTMRAATIVALAALSSGGIDALSKYLLADTSA